MFSRLIHLLFQVSIVKRNHKIVNKSADILTTTDSYYTLNIVNVRQTNI